MRLHSGIFKFDLEVMGGLGILGGLEGGKKEAGRIG